MSSSLTLCNKEQRILWDCDVPKKWILYKKWRWLVSSVLGLTRSSKALPKAKLHQKRSWSLFGDLLPVWSTTAVWIPARPLHLRSILSKWMSFTTNCKVCSQHWSTERAQFFSMTIPDRMSHNQCFKSWLNQLGYEVLPHLPYTPDFSPTDYHFFNHLDNFLQAKCFHNQQEIENAFQEFLKSWSSDFYATGINKLTSCWQKCVDCKGSYFD